MAGVSPKSNGGHPEEWSRPSVLLSFLKSVIGKKRTLFLGDLDPQDLSIYLSLRAGGDTLPSHSVHSLDLEYCGIHDGWIDLGEQRFKEVPWTREPFLAAMSVKLTRLERSQLAALDELADLGKLLGERSAALLRGGRKIELEPLLQTSYFDSRYQQEIARLW